jgi:hypothetical protein
MRLLAASLLEGSLDSVEGWLAFLAVAGGLAIAWKRLFGNGQTIIRMHHCERQHQMVDQRLQGMGTRSEVLLERVERRISEIESRMARLEERIAR